MLVWSVPFLVNQYITYVKDFVLIPSLNDNLFFIVSSLPKFWYNFNTSQPIWFFSM